jgi:hypothetical protein
MRPVVDLLLRERGVVVAVLEGVVVAAAPLGAIHLFIICLSLQNW